MSPWEHYRDSHKKYVSILYVREFVADNAFKLGTRHQREKSGRRADDGVFSSRPVANAFGAGSSITYSFGFGKPAVMARFSVTV